MLASIERLKELIARREEVDNTVAQFERMTVSHLVERSRQDLSESDDEISECKDFVSEAHEELSHAHNKKDKMSKLKSGQKKQISYGKWDYESSVTPPLYKFEVSGSIPVPLLWNVFLESLFLLILITTVLSCTNSLSRTSFDFSLKTSFVYSNLFSLAKTPFFFFFFFFLAKVLAKLKRFE